MKSILTITQLVISILLIILILLQSKGSGLSTVFGGEGGFYRSRRGVEKLFVYFTIILAMLFFTVSVLQFLV